MLTLETIGKPGKVWREYKYNMDHGPDIARYIARTCFAWPGGYELFAVTDHGGILCYDCCYAEYLSIRTAVPGDGFYIVGYDSEANTDEFLNCDHCGRIFGGDV